MAILAICCLWIVTDVAYGGRMDRAYQGPCYYIDRR